MPKAVLGHEKTNPVLQSRRYVLPDNPKSNASMAAGIHDLVTQRYSHLAEATIFNTWLDQPDLTFACCHDSWFLLAPRVLYETSASAHMQPVAVTLLRFSSIFRMRVLAFLDNV